jgi:hypothetical protein
MPQPPPSVQLATGDSLLRRDPARSYGRWLGIVLSVWLLATVLLPREGHWLPLSHIRFPSPLTSFWLWHGLIFPAAAGVMGVIGCCLPRRARGVLLVLAGTLVCCRWPMFTLVRLCGGDPLPPSPVGAALLISLFWIVAPLSLVGGFDAARRTVGHKGRRWAPLAPALVLVASYIALALLVPFLPPRGGPFAESQWTVLSGVWWVALIRGVEQWLPVVMTILWASSGLAAVTLAVLHAVRLRTPLARWGLACGLLFVALPLLLFPIQRLVGRPVWQYGLQNDRTVTRDRWGVLETLGTWLPWVCGEGLAILGFSTIWAVRRAAPADLPVAQPAS